MLDQLISLETSDVDLNIHILFPVSVDEEYSGFTVLFVERSGCVDIGDVVIIVRGMEVVDVESFCGERRCIYRGKDGITHSVVPQLIERIVCRAVPGVLTVKGDSAADTAGHAADLDPVRMAHQHHKDGSLAKSIHHRVFPAE